ncbi:hypothetical protein NVP1155O_04 [Vibrio phage 1.155.O._10N.222.55.B3]|nr:hypothetical protein NVP1155O_04 [Vibrio phage 1.155.O._10N.222.55.B3]
MAEDILIESGFDFDEMVNDSFGIYQAQLKFFSQFAVGINLRKNAYKTIHRLRASKNKKNLDFEANLRNTMIGTVKAALMEEFERVPKEQQGEIIIKWLPSSAHEADDQHGLQYGRIMTMREALRRGLGTRWGCQCGFKVISGGAIVTETINQFKKSIKK